MRTPILIATLMLTLALALSGCGKSDPPAPAKDAHDHDHAGHDHDHDHDHDKAEHHDHAPPHGGALVAVGGAHLEFKLDEATGKVTVWVLDGEAAKPVRIAQPSFKMTARLLDKDGADAGKPAAELSFTPVASGLTGETAGDSSQYEASSDELKGVVAFEGTIGAVTIQGTEHKHVTVNYPKGNEP